MIYKKFAVDAEQSGERKRDNKIALEAFFIIYFVRENPPQHENCFFFGYETKSSTLLVFLLCAALLPCRRFHFMNYAFLCRLWRFRLEFSAGGAENENKVD